MQGGLHNSLVRALQQLGLADAFGACELPMLVLNVTYPLVPEEVADFCAGKRAVIVVEEGSPEYIEHEILATLARRGVATAIHGKDLLPATGEYTVEVLAGGLAVFCERHLTDVAADARYAAGKAWLAGNAARRQAVAGGLAQPLPARPPAFCVGCPQRPVFPAPPLAQPDSGPRHSARGQRPPPLPHRRHCSLHTPTLAHAPHRTKRGGHRTLK